MIKTRLETYRRKRHAEEMTESIKKSLNVILSWNRNTPSEESSQPLTDDLEVNNGRTRVTNLGLDDAEDTSSTCSDDSASESESTLVTKATYVLYFLLWVTLYVIAVEYQFGAVYFIVSMLVFICVNTRTKSKKKGELSAYSVFNPNCEAIEGTLDASQFEKEIMYGIGGMR